MSQSASHLKQLNYRFVVLGCWVLQKQLHWVNIVIKVTSCGVSLQHAGLFCAVLSKHEAPTLLDTIAVELLRWWASLCLSVPDKHPLSGAWFRLRIAIPKDTLGPHLDTAMGFIMAVKQEAEFALWKFNVNSNLKWSFGQAVYWVKQRPSVAEGLMVSINSQPRHQTGNQSVTFLKRKIQSSDPTD